MFDNRKLDPRTARELTSREVSKIIGSLLGGLAGMARPESIFEALDFYAAEKNQVPLDSLYRTLWNDAVKQGFVIPDPENQHKADHG